MKNPKLEPYVPSEAASVMAAMQKIETDIFRSKAGCTQLETHSYGQIPIVSASSYNTKHAGSCANHFYIIVSFSEPQNLQIRDYHSL